MGKYKPDIDGDYTGEPDYGWLIMIIEILFIIGVLYVLN